MRTLKPPCIAIAALIASAFTAPQSCAEPPAAIVIASEAAHQPSVFDTLPLHAPDVGPAIAATVGIFLTGDGGWAPFDTRVSEDMSRAGVPTIGFDTGEYFSTMRTPEEAAEALGQAMSAAMEKYHAQRVILVGYSFGADVAPFLVNRLPDHLRRSIDRVALMSPSDTAPFQVTLLERAGLEAPGARPVIPELTEMTAQGHRTVCLYGENDHDAICTKMSPPDMRSVQMRGGHGLHDDHQSVANAILTAWPLDT
jgi:type IV secretory pathway VirJ component